MAKLKNGVVVTAILEQIGQPATATDVAKHINDVTKTGVKSLMPTVKKTLLGGATYGFLACHRGKFSLNRYFKPKTVKGRKSKKGCARRAKQRKVKKPKPKPKRNATKCRAKIGKIVKGRRKVLATQTRGRLPVACAGRRGRAVCRRRIVRRGRAKGARMPASFSVARRAPVKPRKGGGRKFKRRGLKSTMRKGTMRRRRIFGGKSLRKYTPAFTRNTLKRIVRTVRGAKGVRNVRCVRTRTIQARGGQRKTRISRVVYVPRGVRVVRY